MRANKLVLMFAAMVLSVNALPGVRLQINCGKGWKNKGCYCSSESCRSAGNKSYSECNFKCVNTYECGTC